MNLINNEPKQEIKALAHLERKENPLSQIESRILEIVNESTKINSDIKSLENSNNSPQQIAGGLRALNNMLQDLTVEKTTLLSQKIAEQKKMDELYTVNTGTKTNDEGEDFEKALLQDPYDRATRRGL